MWSCNILQELCGRHSTIHLNQKSLKLLFLLSGSRMATGALEYFSSVESARFCLVRGRPIGLQRRHPLVHELFHGYLIGPRFSFKPSHENKIIRGGGGGGSNESPVLLNTPLETTCLLDLLT